MRDAVHGFGGYFVTRRLAGRGAPAPHQQLDAVEGAGETEVEGVDEVVEPAVAPERAHRRVVHHAGEQVGLLAPPVQVRHPGGALLAHHLRELPRRRLDEAGDQRHHRHHLGRGQAGTAHDTHRAVELRQRVGSRQATAAGGVHQPEVTQPQLPVRAGPHLQLGAPAPRLPRVLGLAGALARARRQFAEDGVAHQLDEFGAARHVPVERHRGEAEPLGDPPHRQLGEAVLVGDRHRGAHDRGAVQAGPVRGGVTRRRGPGVACLGLPGCHGLLLAGSPLRLTAVPSWDLWCTRLSVRGKRERESSRGGSGVPCRPVG